MTKLMILKYTIPWYLVHSQRCAIIFIYLVSKIFITSKRDLILIKHFSLNPAYLQALATTNSLLSLWVYLFWTHCMIPLL